MEPAIDDALSPSTSNATATARHNVTHNAYAHQQEYAQIRPVIDISRFNAFPQAARARELAKATKTCASSGKNVFVHYTEPILTRWRTALLSSGTTKKLYHKTAAQLWPTIGHDEDVFWNQRAKEIRASLKSKQLSVEECLEFTGGRTRTRECLWHAEIAVSAYLGISQPPPAPLPLRGYITGEAKEEKEPTSTIDMDLNLQSALKTASLGPPPVHINTCTPEQEDVLFTQQTNPEQISPTSITNHHTHYILLAVLPNPFTPTQYNTLYGNLGALNHTEIEHAEGRTQTTYLRRVAQMLDDTGKELFYYYVIPRVCATVQPRLDGSTATGIAADVWKYMPGERKGKWMVASQGLKRRLGDGEVVGLEALKLGALDGEVLALHEMARVEVDGYVLRRDAHLVYKMGVT